MMSHTDRSFVRGGKLEVEETTPLCCSVLRGGSAPGPGSTGSPPNHTTGIVGSLNSISHRTDRVKRQWARQPQVADRAWDSLRVLSVCDSIKRGSARVLRVRIVIV